MTIKGVDYSWDKPQVSALKAAGIKFACRYLSPDPSKNLTRAEAAALLGAGISIVVVWESTAGRIRDGYSAGLQDATAAIGQARSCGLTDPIVIYFACDYDSTASDQPAINAYLDGAAQVLGRDFTGLYGGYWAISRARAAGKAVWYWGTYAWSGNMWATCGWLPHIMQAIGTTSFGGVDTDIDTAYTADYGQWPRPSAPKPPEPPVSATGPANWDAADDAHIVNLLTTLEQSLPFRDIAPLTLLWWLPYAISGVTNTAMTPGQAARVKEVHAALQNVIPPITDVPTADQIAAAVIALLPAGAVDEAIVIAGVQEAMTRAFPPEHS